MLKRLFVCLFCFSTLLASESEQQGQWDAYYEDTLNATDPRFTLRIAQELFSAEEKLTGLAVDLGTGTGRDALFLIDQGWNVLATDAEALALEILLSRVQEDKKHLLEVSLSSFSSMDLPPNTDLINASYSLPFCAPDDFPAAWQKIVDSLAIGGRFSGQLFGDHDAWADDPMSTFHTEEQMYALFSDNFTIEYIKIVDDEVAQANGELKHWHLYHVVARKIK